MASTKSSQKRLKTSYINKLFSLLFIAFGAFFLFFAAFGHFNLTLFKTVNAVNEPSVPVRIYIPQMNRVLSVSDGTVENNHWVVSPSGVSYLTGSTLPGAVGNSVIYGHNTIDALGGLWRVHEGDLIYVVTSDGQFYKYEVFERKEIDPTQVDILNQTTDSRLTIYTCSGFLDSARFVVVSRLKTN